MATKLSTATADTIALEGYFEVDLIPAMSITLDAQKTLAVSEPKHAIGIEGTLIGFPSSWNNADATLDWQVRYDPKVPPKRETLFQSHRVDGSINRNKGDRFYFADQAGNKPTLDLFEHDLFGKGTVTYRLEVRLPHPVAQQIEERDAKITFENVIKPVFKIGSAEAGKSEPLGTPLEIAINMDGLPSAIADNIKKNCIVDLVIRERDAGTDALTEQREHRHKGRQATFPFTWPSGAEDYTGVWYVGCLTVGAKDAGGKTTGTAVRPVVSESTEEGGYEFSYRLTVTDPTRGVPNKKVVGGVDDFLIAPKPKVEDADLYMMAPFFGKVGPLLSMTVSGVGSGLPMVFDVSLWATKESGRGYQLIVPNQEIRLARWTDGTHRCHQLLHEFPGPADGYEFSFVDPIGVHLRRIAERGDESKLNEKRLFLSVAIDESFVGKSVPMRVAFDYDQQAYSSFDTKRGVFSRSGASMTVSPGLSIDGILLSLVGDAKNHQNAYYGRPFLRYDGERLTWMEYYQDKWIHQPDADWHARETEHGKRTDFSGLWAAKLEGNTVQLSAEGKVASITLLDARGQPALPTDLEKRWRSFHENYDAATLVLEFHKRKP
jgi:hypothetical protein